MSAKVNVTETPSPDENSTPRIVITRHSISVVRGLYVELKLPDEAFELMNRLHELLLQGVLKK
jgi:hypothetical protein